MRLTLTLHRVSHSFLRKQLWKRRGYVSSIPLMKSSFLQKKEFVDPNATAEEEMTWEPTNPDARQYQDPPKIQDHPDYHEDSFVYEFHNNSRLMENLQQACILTKTKPHFELPEQVEACIGRLDIPEQDQLLQRYIMQANVWDPTKAKLPRRINPSLPGWRYKAEWGIPDRKTRSILLQNIVRLLRMIGGRHDDLLTSRSVLQQPQLYVMYSLYGDKPVLVRGSQECILMSKDPLPRFATEDDVRLTLTHDLPDLHPLSPLIDLRKQPLFREGVNITGYRSGFPYDSPHTLYMQGHPRFRPQELQARMLMYSFGYCLATARAKYGPSVTELPDPVCLQTVLTQGSSFYLSSFQLNTTDLSSRDGVKNMAWFDGGRRMYEKVLPARAMLRNTKYEDYDPEVFSRILGLYAYGGRL